MPQERVHSRATELSWQPSPSARIWHEAEASLQPDGGAMARASVCFGHSCLAATSPL